jgi:hypothetical protein
MLELAISSSCPSKLGNPPLVIAFPPIIEEQLELLDGAPRAAAPSGTDLEQSDISP